MSDSNRHFSERVPEDMHKVRLDKVLAQLIPDLSRSRMKALIDDGLITVNGIVETAASYKALVGDRIEFTLPELEEALPQPENIALDIIFADDDLLVINKHVGLVVHPGAGNPDGTLVNALLHHCGDSLSGIGGVKRPGIVHRLDKDTSGLLVVAKHDKAHQFLSDQLADRSLSRLYKAIVWKVPTPLKGSIDRPIGRHKTNRQKMTIGGVGARDARTHYHVREEFGDGVMSFVDCKLESGRTHQIRVHMMHIRHPLIGDEMYGLPQQEQIALLKRGGYDQNTAKAVLHFGRQALHSAEIRFIHPQNQEEMSFSAPSPDDMLNLYNLLK